jgi:hypothetical protein
MAAPGQRPWLQWVDKRLSDGNNMRLLSLNKGVVHGYRHEDRTAYSTVEQGQAVASVADYQNYLR